MQLKVGMGSESESDNRNFPESELESDEETSDSTALVQSRWNKQHFPPTCYFINQLLDAKK